MWRASCSLPCCWELATEALERGCELESPPTQEQTEPSCLVRSEMVGEFPVGTGALVSRSGGPFDMAVSVSVERERLRGIGES